MTTELTPEGGVQLNSFAPAPVIEWLDWGVGGLLAVLLLSNLWRMHRWILGREPGLQVRWSAYARGVSTLATHFLTQKHPSDWIFLVLLLLTTVTGILVHLFRIHGLPYPTYYAYVIHMAVLVPMLVVEVPFSKWAHLAYRPVALYLQQHGYKIVPVTPKAPEILGERTYPSLREVPGQVDIVAVFRKPEAVPEIVDAAIAMRAKAVWMQIGIVHNTAADRARSAGLKVVMSRCMMVEHRNRRPAPANRRSGEAFDKRSQSPARTDVSRSESGDGQRTVEGKELAADGAKPQCSGQYRTR